MANNKTNYPQIKYNTMKKDLGIIPAVYPMPVLMVSAHDANGNGNVMNDAWGMICDM